MENQLPLMEVIDENDLSEEDSNLMRDYIIKKNKERIRKARQEAEYREFKRSQKGSNRPVELD